MVWDMRGLLQVVEVRTGEKELTPKAAPLRAEEKPGGSSACSPQEALQALEALQVQLRA